MKNLFKSLLPNKVFLENKNPKFSKLNQNDIDKRLNKLKNILGINENIKSELLSDKTILIKECEFKNI